MGANIIGSQYAITADGSYQRVLLRTLTSLVYLPIEKITLDTKLTNMDTAITARQTAAQVNALINAKVDVAGISGNAATATKLQTVRSIAISGGATGTATNFDGSANITIPVTALDPSKITGTVPVSKGGLNKSTVAVDAMLYASAANTYAEVATTAFGRSLLSAASDTKFTGLYSDKSATTERFRTAVNIGAASFDGTTGITLASMGAAPLDSPGLTGVPTAPTAVNSTDSTQIATTAFVKSVLAEKVDVTGISGNAATATKLQTARTIAISGGATGTATSFDGSANISISITALDPSKITGTVPVSKGGLNLSTVSANAMLYASAANTYGEVATSAFGRSLLNSTSGTKFTGLYADRAATADKLQTAVSIGSASFDGSTSITLASMGAAPLNSPGLTGTPTAPTATAGTNTTQVATTAFVTTAMTGNAGSATKLQTTRTIALSGGVSGSASFDGSANITITATVADDSHNHIISNVDGLQTALDARVALGGGTMTGALTLSGDPTNPLHAATKQYVDNMALGLDTKDSVHVASTAAIAVTTATTTTLTLTSAFTVIDDITLVVGDRILLKNQTDTTQNGIYVYSSSTLLTRASDADTSAKIKPSMFVFVEEGTTNADSGWTLTTNAPITLGTTGLTFVQFSGAGQIVNGTGLSKNGNTLSISNTGITAGTYRSVTFNAQGQATAGTNPTTISEYGITDAVNTFDVVTTATANKILKLNASGQLPTSITGNAATATKVYGVATGTNSVDLVYGTMADSDAFRITVGGTATDSGFAEIATADNGNEPIYVRQYTGAFATVTRTLTLLDANGNTSLPGTVTAPTFIGALTGNASTASKWATTRNISLSGDASGSATIDGSGDVSISATIRKTAFIGSDVAASAGWYKVASQTMTGYGNFNATFMVTSTFSSYTSGILEVQIRSENTSIICQSLKWLSRTSDLPLANFIIVIGGMTWTLYAYQPVTQFGRIGFEILSMSNTTGKTLGYTLTFQDNNTVEGTAPTATVISSDGGHVNSANKLLTARNISLGGDATGSATFDGSDNITITATVDKVDGYHVGGNTGNNGATWTAGYIPVVKTDGVMEVGKFLDFHTSSNDGADYAYRLTATAGTITGSGKFVDSEIKATSKFNINDKASIQFNTTDNCLEFIFA